MQESRDTIGTDGLAMKACKICGKQFADKTGGLRCWAGRSKKLTAHIMAQCVDCGQEFQYHGHVRHRCDECQEVHRQLAYTRFFAYKEIRGDLWNMKVISPEAAKRFVQQMVEEEGKAETIEIVGSVLWLSIMESEKVDNLAGKAESG